MQRELSDTPLPPEQLDAEIRKLLARVMRSPECRLSRIEVCQALSKLIDPRCEIDCDSLFGKGLPVSLHMLNAYCAQHHAAKSGKLRFPAFLVPAFCEVTQNFEMLRLIVGQHLPRLLELEKERKAAARAKSARKSKPRKARPFVVSTGTTR
jgi:hypothetical protein